MKSFYSNFMTTSGVKSLSAVFGLILSLAILANAAPANDNFADAQVISGVNNFVNGTNVASTVEANEPAHALNRGGGSVWYKYIAPGNGILRIHTGGSNFNTLLAVYQGTNISDLKLVVANDNYNENGTFGIYSNVRVGAKTGDVFYIAVDGFNDNGVNGTQSGAIKLNYFFENVVTNDNFANAIILGQTGKQITTTANVGASKEAGEPNHGGNVGGKSVWYRWTAPAGVAKTVAFSVESIGVTAANSAQTLLAIYTGTSVDALSEVARGANYFYSKAVFKTVPGTTYYIAIDGFDSGQGANLVTTTLSYGVNESDKIPDVDGDGKADITVFRPTTGTFYSLSSVTDKMSGYQWGTNGDKPLIVDKNRDGKVDYTVFRPDTGVWYIDRSDSISFEIFNWGLNTDIPMYRRRHTTTGINDAISTVFRPSTGTWYQYLGANSPIIVNWGLSGDIPVMADFTGDGTDDLTVFRPSTGTWYILLNSNTAEHRQVQFGQSGDIPVAADYDGDGAADIAIYRPSTGTWWLLDNQTGAQTAQQFGLATDKPQAADYDGDNKADIAVYRPSTKTWWILQSSNGTAKGVAFGLSSDIPITAPAN